VVSHIIFKSEKKFLRIERMQITKQHHSQSLVLPIEAMAGLIEPSGPLGGFWLSIVKETKIVKLLTKMHRTSPGFDTSSLSSPLHHTPG
jgi:hypothetical protein